MKILFIGNSYTYYNNLPQLLENLINENEMDIEIDSLTVGGRKLYENLSLDDEKYIELCNLLTKNSYDILFLQEQSFLPLLDYCTFEKGVADLINLIKAKRNILYVTWGRKDGANILKEYGLTNETMTIKLNTAYQKVAFEYNCETSLVGLYFNYITSHYPILNLYDDDLSHPSYLGSCLAALIHYKTIFKTLPNVYSTLKIDNEILETFISVLNKNIY